MQALVKAHPREGLWMRDVPVPDPGPDQVLVKVRQTGICGTDLHIWNWDEWARSTIAVPTTIGHEFVGEIVAHGRNVRHLSRGQRVSGEGHVVCMHGRAALPDVARAIERLSDRLDSRLQVMLAIVPAPAELAPRLAQDDHNRLGALTAIAFADDATEAERLHAPLGGEPALQAVLDRETIDPAGFDDIFAMTDMALTAPRVRADNIFTDRLGEAVLR